MASSGPEMIVHSTSPFNAEPRLDLLRQNFLTPQELFYVRSHGNVPAIDLAAYRLHVGGTVANPLALSFDELRSQFVAHTITAVLQCAGNRRAGLHAVRPVSGDPWEAGAIGNATWTGARLADVLQAAGFDNGNVSDVEFVSCDDVEMKGQRFAYTVSIPITKALAPEVLLAWEMNGVPLLAEHGFPLRVVVPGYAGVRSVKWLSAINLSDAPSRAYVQAEDYKLLPPDATEDSADPQHALTINKLPLNAAICEPQSHVTLPGGPLTIRGYAIATHGAAVERVDVSSDGGRKWHQAELEKHAATPWTWTPWNITLTLAAGAHELVVRAWDESGQTQPAQPDDAWNYKGYLNTSWHRVPVRVS